jgi:hypothetical protein
MRVACRSCRMGFDVGPKGSTHVAMQTLKYGGKTLPPSSQAAMLWAMWSASQFCVPPLPYPPYRCKHETLHQLQTRRIPQAGGNRS